MKKSTKWAIAFYGWIFVVLGIIVLGLVLTSDGEPYNFQKITVIDASIIISEPDSLGFIRKEHNYNKLIEETPVIIPIQVNTLDGPVIIELIRMKGGPVHWRIQK